MSIALSDVGDTSLVTLYCRAIESARRAAILSDPVAVELTRKLDPILESSSAPLYRHLLRRRLARQPVAYVALRARHFDARARDHAGRHEGAVVVNLGCGFDTRFHRIDDGRLRLFDLDRAEVLSVKRRLLEESDRYRFVEASVTASDWLRQLPADGPPPLFLAEGLLMYLPIEEVRSLVLRLRERFAGAELVAEVFNSRWLAPWIKWSVDLKLRRKLHVGRGATFLSGLRDSRDMEAWGPGIELIGDWCALDEPDPGLGAVRLLRRFDLVRKTQWVVHYRLG